MKEKNRHRIKIWFVPQHFCGIHSSSNEPVRLFKSLSTTIQIIVCRHTVLKGGFTWVQLKKNSSRNQSSISITLLLLGKMLAKSNWRLCLVERKYLKKLRNMKPLLKYSVKHAYVSLISNLLYLKKLKFIFTTLNGTRLLMPVCKCLLLTKPTLRLSECTFFTYWHVKMTLTLQMKSLLSSFSAWNKLKAKMQSSTSTFQDSLQDTADAKIKFWKEPYRPLRFQSCCSLKMLLTRLKSVISKLY